MREGYPSTDFMESIPPTLTILDLSLAINTSRWLTVKKQGVAALYSVTCTKAHVDSMIISFSLIIVGMGQ